MAEYIGREAITEYLMGRIKNYLEMGDRLAIIPLNFAMAYIKSLPAADVAPVVRCRDCQKMKTFECPMQSCGYDDFCSQGERRTGNG